MKVMTVLLFLSLSFSACAQQPSREQVAIWTYFVRQCESEGIQINDKNAMYGCVMLKERQANIALPQGNQFGNILQGMGAALNPQVYQAFASQPQSTDCHAIPLLAGGYRTVCQ